MSNPCDVGVSLEGDYRGTWGFTHWCVCRGRRVVWGSWPAPTGLAVIGMSWNLRWVFAGVALLSYSGASVGDSVGRVRCSFGCWPRPVLSRCQSYLLIR